MADVFSRLPTDIIHHIFTSFTMKEEARSSLICKHWYSSYSTRPILKFIDDDFGNIESLPLFFEFIKNTLHKFHNKKTLIDEICFHINSDIKSSDLPPNIIDLVVQVAVACSVRKLYFRSPYRAITLPRSIYEADSLVKLCLYMFNLPDPIDNVGFKHLKMLQLLCVKFENDSVLEKILSSCSSIEDLSTEVCYVPPTICLGQKLPKLKKLEVVFGDGGNVVDLDGLPRVMTDLSLTGVALPERFLENFRQKFPQLVSLRLVRCSGVQEKLYISSESIENLVLAWIDSIVEMDLDLSNLLHFSYSGYDIPSLSMSYKLEKVESSILLVCNDIVIDSSWFHKLRRILNEPLDLSKSSLELNFKNIVRVEEVLDLPPYLILEIDQLELEFSREVPLNYYRVLLSGLLSMFRPNTVRLLDSELFNHLKLVEPLWKILMEKKGQDSNGCSHQLKEIEVTVSTFSKKYKVISMDEYKTIKGRKRILFKLEWEEPSL